MFERDGDAEAWIAVRKIGCAVERINNPSPLAFALIQNLRRAGFLCEHSMTREVRIDALDDETFRSKVCLRHQINVALVRDLSTAHALGQNAARIKRCLNSKVKHKKVVGGRWSGVSGLLFL